MLPDEGLSLQNRLNTNRRRSVPRRYRERTHRKRSPPPSCNRAAAGRSAMPAARSSTRRTTYPDSSRPAPALLAHSTSLKLPLTPTAAPNAHTTNTHKPDQPTVSRPRQHLRTRRASTPQDNLHADPARKATPPRRPDCVTGSSSSSRHGTHRNRHQHPKQQQQQRPHPQQVLAAYRDRLPVRSRFNDQLDLPAGPDCGCQRKTCNSFQNNGELHISRNLYSSFGRIRSTRLSHQPTGGSSFWLSAQNLQFSSKQR